MTDRTFRGLSQAVYILIGTCHSQPGQLPHVATLATATATQQRACEKSQLANLLIKIIEFRTRFIKRARSAAANQAGLLATCHTVTTCHLPQSELQLQLQFAVIASQPATSCKWQLSAAKCCPAACNGCCHCHSHSPCPCHCPCSCCHCSTWVLLSLCQIIISLRLR